MSLDTIYVEDPTKFKDQLTQDTNQFYLEMKAKHQAANTRISEVVLKVTKSTAQNPSPESEGKILKTGPNPTWTNPPQHRVHLFVNDEQHLQQDEMRGENIHKIFSNLQNIKTVQVQALIYDSQFYPAILAEKTWHYKVK